MTADHADRFLVARLLRGDEDAFAQFFEASFGPLFRFALPRVDGDRHAAEDVVQTTLVRALRGLATYRGEAALRTWLTTICRREIATHFKTRRKADLTPNFESHARKSTNRANHVRVNHR